VSVSGDRPSEEHLVGALNPFLLIAGLAVGVPIFLHLFQKHQTRRINFPALRYLERTKREHAKQIRLRQLLLLMARIAVVLFIVGAGARLVFFGRGASHPPTAAVIVLDNSLSSGLVVGERRVLDELKALAHRALDASQEEDRFWVIRAGEPWLPAIPGSAEATRTAIDETEPSEAAGDLTGALERAVRLLTTSDMQQTEVHLLSDLQRTGFTLPGGAPAGNVPVVVWAGHEPPAFNRALTGIVVGGGLPPLVGQRTEVTVSALGSTHESDTAHVPIRLIVNERIRGAATLPPGAQTTIAMPPSGSGWVQGYADADPDDLRADDRRFFSYRSRPAPSVAVGGTPGVFVAEALAVLEGAERVRSSTPRSADVLVSQAGLALSERSSAHASMVIPPLDRTLLPALNLRLSEAGIPWQLDVTNETGEAALEGTALPLSLAGIRVATRYDLRLNGDPPAPTRTLAEVAGRPWAVEGTTATGSRYLLLASSLESNSTTLPVSTGMLQFIDWVASEWAAAGGGLDQFVTGASITAPGLATHIRVPSGAEFEVDGTRAVRSTGKAGFYTFLSSDTAVSVVALNPPEIESRLAPLDPIDFSGAIGSDVTTVDREDAWDRSIFRRRQGPELWWPLLLAALGVLTVEALMATSGRSRISSLGTDTQSMPGTDGAK
jgi:hypothetical protein